MYYVCYVLLYCIIFAFGAAIGSFLNVCIYRLPKEESLWRNNSHCMPCGTPIRKRDLLPVPVFLKKALALGKSLLTGINSTDIGDFCIFKPKQTMLSANYLLTDDIVFKLYQQIIHIIDAPCR